MKIIPGIFTFAYLLIALPMIAQVSPPDNRKELLEKAERLVAKELSPEVRARFALVVDPFYTASLEEEEQDETLAEVEIELSDEEILAEISALINPRGILKRGSQTLLVIDDNRVPVGQFLSAHYKGKDYRIQLVQADARTFVLRLNDQFITRKIR